MVRRTRIHEVRIMSALTAPATRQMVPAIRSISDLDSDGLTWRCRSAQVHSNSLRSPVSGGNAPPANRLDLESVEEQLGEGVPLVGRQVPPLGREGVHGAQVS
jgi:hypothetical protein